MLRDQPLKSAGLGAEEAPSIFLPPAPVMERGVLYTMICLKTYIT